MAQGYHDFVAGEVLSAANLEDYCQNQAVMRFASTAARDTALSTVKTNGMLSYQTDTSTLTVYDGTGWIILAEPIQTSTPTLTNITLGTPGQVNTLSYHRSDGWCDFVWNLTLGTGGAFTGNGSFTLPMTPAVVDKGQFKVIYRDASAPTDFVGSNEASGSATISLYTQTVSGANLIHGSTSATLPFTWTVSDTIVVTGRFRMSTRYL